MENYKTFGELEQEVREDTDTIEQDFVSESLMRQYFNDGVDRIEADIQKYEVDDYFLSYMDVPYENGMREIPLPDDIYIHKVRSLVFYEQNNYVYTMERLRSIEKFELMAYQEINSNQAYFAHIGYFMTHKKGEGPKILLTPNRYTTFSGPTFIRLWYRRQIQKMVDLEIDGNVLGAREVMCDIPEFHFALKFYVKSRIYDKADEPSNHERAMQQYIESMTTMKETIENMMPDGQNMIKGDFTHYRDSEGGHSGY